MTPRVRWTRWMTAAMCSGVVAAMCGGVAAVGAQGAGGAAKGEAAGRLLVLSKQAQTLAVVDPATLRVEARVPVGDDPHEVTASEDGRRAYVSNYGFGAFHTLAVVDLERRRALAPVDLGPLGGPHGLAWNGGKVWFTTEAAKAVGRYDPAAGKVDWVVGDGQDRTHMVWVSADGTEVIASNVESGTMSFHHRVEKKAPPAPAFVNGRPTPPRQASSARAARFDWEQTLVKVGGGSEGFDVSPDGREVWVGNAKDGTVSVIDRGAMEVRATLRLNVDGVNRVKFTPDGRFVFLSGIRGGAEPLWVVDARTRAVVKKLAVGRGAAGIAMEPGGRRAFVACSPDGYVAVIDLGSMQMTGKIDAGPEPDGMTWAANAR